MGRNRNIPAMLRKAFRLRGVTLLELLIVIAVLAALMAIALPFTMRSLEARELESTEEGIASELIKARVKAQESGRPVEVVVLDAPPRVVVRYFSESRDESDSSTVVSARADIDGVAESDVVATAPRHENSTGRRVRDSWWEESVLHPSVSVSGAAEREAPTTSDIPMGGSPLRLAVYLPDGTTLFAATLLLMHQNGLSSRVSVDPWTGQPEIKRGAKAPAADASSDEADGVDSLDELNDGSASDDDAVESDPLDGFETETGR
jgi:prepilin-type N-terminal cleavage/methylation domain-containing protein